MIVAVVAATVLVLAPLVPLAHWLLCRWAARRCPECGSRWRTELLGEWAGWELWTCHACRHCWQVYYRRGA